MRFRPIVVREFSEREAMYVVYGGVPHPCGRWVLPVVVGSFAGSSDDHVLCRGHPAGAVDVASRSELCLPSRRYVEALQTKVTSVIVRPAAFGSSSTHHEMR